MTRERYVAVAGLLAALVCAGLLAALLIPDDQPGVTKANVDRLQIGMARTEVDSLLGAGRSVAHLLTDPLQERSPGQRGAVTLVFDDDDKLIRITWADRVESFGEKIRRWLPWLPF